MPYNLKILKKVFKEGVQSVPKVELDMLFAGQGNKLYRYPHEKGAERFMKEGWKPEDINQWTTPTDDPKGIYWSPSKKSFKEYQHTADPELSWEPRKDVSNELALKNYPIVEGLRRPGSTIKSVPKGLEESKLPSTDFLVRKYPVETDAGEVYPDYKEVVQRKPGNVLAKYKDTYKILGLGGLGLVAGDMLSPGDAEAMPLGKPIKGLFKTFAEGMQNKSGLSIKQANYNGKTHLIARENGREVGEIAYISRPDGNAEISNVLVHPEFQRKGKGTQLYMEAYNVARDQGKKLYVSSNRTDDALALHRSFSKSGILRRDGEIDFSNVVERDMKKAGQLKPAVSSASDRLKGMELRGGKISGVYQGIGDSRYIHMEDGRIFPTDKDSLNELCAEFGTQNYVKKFGALPEGTEQGSARWAQILKSYEMNQLKGTPSRISGGRKPDRIRILEDSLTDRQNMIGSAGLADQVLVQDNKTKKWWLWPRVYAEPAEAAGLVRIDKGKNTLFTNKGLK